MSVLFKIILFATLIICVKSKIDRLKIDLKYDDKIAYTIEDGIECINNCVNGKCIVDESMKEHSCQKTHLNTPVHRTIHDKVCLSRCYEDKVYTGKCYINQDGDWDYCESSRKVEWIRDRTFTEYNGPCKDTCRSSDGARFRCNHYWSGSDNCFPQKGNNYIQARTITGKICRGSCSRHLGRDHTWCAHTMRNEEACALPGMPRPLDWSKEINTIIAIKKPICIRIKDLEIDCDTNKEDIKTGVFERFAQDLEYDPKHYTPFLREGAQPIYSYTTKDGTTYRSKDGFEQIPVVVRASIHPRHLYLSHQLHDEASRIPKEVKTNLERTAKKPNDKVGYLVSFSMSGPSENFNVYNRKSNTSYDEDKIIVEFLEKHKLLLHAKVELTAIALYRKGEMRPSGVLRRVEFYHTNSLVDLYYEYLPNEDHDETDLPDAIEELELLPPVDFNQELNGKCYNSGLPSNIASTTERP